MNKKLRSILMLECLMLGIFAINLDFGQSSSAPTTYPWYMTSSYIIDEDFTIAGNIYTQGFDLTIKDCYINVTGSYSIYSSGNENITFSNVGIIGSGTSAALQIYSNGGSLNVTNCFVSGLTGTTFLVNTVAWITNNIFENCYLPIECVYAHNSNISFNYFSGCDTAIEFRAYAYNENITLLNNSISNGYYGIRPNSLVNSIIKNNSINQCSISGIEGSDVITWSLIENNLIKKCTTGFYQNRIENSIVRNNTIQNSTVDGFMCTLIDNVTIINNIVSSTDGRAMSILMMDQFPVISNISNNQIYIYNTGTSVDPIKSVDYLFGTNFPGIFQNTTSINDVSVRTYYNLNDLTLNLSGVKISRLALFNCTNLSFQNVEITNGDGIEILNCTNVNIENFNSTNNYHIGFLVLDCTNCTFSNGNISKNLLNGLEAKTNYYWGDVRWINNCTFENITVNENEQNGIDFNFITNSTLNNCTIEKNKENGIRCTYFDNSLVQFNQIKQNKLGGILCYDNVTENNIYNNTFYQNSFTNIYIDFYCGINTFKWNNLIKNSNTGLNYFNFVSNRNGTVVEMNHYSDYYGFDRDPQNGFGDSSYRVNFTSSTTEVFDLTPLFIDFDLDGLDDYVELYLYGTNFTNNDTDGDGLIDFVELFPIIYFANILDQFTFILNPTNPFLNDTDQDGLNDSAELFDENGFRTDPNNKDSDYDSFNDYLEIIGGTNPLNDSSWPGRENQNLTVIYPENSDPLPEVTQNRSVREIDGYPSWMIYVYLGFMASYLIHRKYSKDMKNPRGVLNE